MCRDQSDSDAEHDQLQQRHSESDSGSDSDSDNDQLEFPQQQQLTKQQGWLGTKNRNRVFHFLQGTFVCLVFVPRGIDFFHSVCSGLATETTGLKNSAAHPGGHLPETALHKPLSQLLGGADKRQFDLVDEQRVPVYDILIVSSSLPRGWVDLEQSAENGDQEEEEQRQDLWARAGNLWARVWTFAGEAFEQFPQVWPLG